MVEVLVAAVLVGVGIVASLQGYAAITRGIARARMTDRMVELGERKAEEIAATVGTSALDGNGDFAAEGSPDLRWESTSAPSAVTDLNALTVTVTGPGDVSQRIETLLYRQPLASEAGGAGTGAPPPAPPGGGGG